MELIDDLREEHALIEQVVGALQTWAATTRLDADRQAFVRFFRVFADHYHHEREEKVLIPAIAATEVPADHGPLAVILRDHVAMRAMVKQLETCPADQVQTLAARYGEALLHHIDAENTVLFPEAELRFMRASVRDLDERDPDGDEYEARLEGERLVRDYPPSEIPGIFRGEGCINCPSYGVSCDGIEREWWSELEWEDAFDRMGNG